MFSKLLSKMREPSTAPHVRTALEDMAEVFVPHLPLDTIEGLYELLKSFLDVSQTFCVLCLNKSFPYF